MSSPFPYSSVSRSSNPKIHPLGKRLHHHRRIPCLQSPRSVLRTLRPSDSSQPTASIKLTRSLVFLPASFYRIKEIRRCDNMPRAASTCSTAATSLHVGQSLRRVIIKGFSTKPTGTKKSNPIPASESTNPTYHHSLYKPTNLQRSRIFAS